MPAASPAAARRRRMKALVLIAISLAAVAVHGKATRALQLAMPDKEELSSVSRRPKAQ
jgi:hypothetical protein